MEGVIIAAIDVEINNVSIGGVALTATRRLDIGKEYALRFEEDGKVCNVKVTVVWSVLSGSKKNDLGDVIPVYKAGMRFSRLYPEKTDIVSFIGHHKKSPEQRAIVRFSLKSSMRKATLDYPLRCEIRDVSLSGAVVRYDGMCTIGDAFPMELILGEGKRIDVVGRVSPSAVAPGDVPAPKDIEIEFVEMSDNSREILKEYLHSP